MSLFVRELLQKGSKIQIIPLPVKSVAQVQPA
jgi:hypothetical protein